MFTSNDCWRFECYFLFVFSHVFCFPLTEVVVNRLYMSAQLWDEKLACGGLFQLLRLTVQIYWEVLRDKWTLGLLTTNGMTKRKKKSADEQYYPLGIKIEISTQRVHLKMLIFNYKWKHDSFWHFSVNPIWITTQLFNSFCYFSVFTVIKNGTTLL